MTFAKRLLTFVLVLMTLFQMVSFATEIEQFKDFPQGWAKDAMTAAVENNILNGTTDTTIEPDKYITRAELAAVIARAFGATAEKDVGIYSDVKPTDWFKSTIAKVVNMGAMNGMSDTAFFPNENIRREDMFLTLARVMLITDENYSVLDKFTDKNLIDSWAKLHITGLVKGNYLNGYEDSTLRPRNSVTRAEVAQIFHNLFGMYIDKPGIYSNLKINKGLVIRTAGVQLHDTTIYGDLVLADGIGAGDCYLENVFVTGRIIVRGGEGLVTFKNVKCDGKVIVNDVNGVVNFNNYRTDVPFKSNLIELTPAKFLEKKETTGTSAGNKKPGDRPQSSVKTSYTTQFWFEQPDGTYVEDETLRITTENTVGTTVSAKFITADQYDTVVFEEDLFHSDRLVSLTLVKNAENNILKRYYSRIEYEVVFKDVNGDDCEPNDGLNGAYVKIGCKLDSMYHPDEKYEQDTEDKYFICWANKATGGTEVVLDEYVFDKQDLTQIDLGNGVYEYKIYVYACFGDKYVVEFHDNAQDTTLVETVYVHPDDNIFEQDMFPAGYEYSVDGFVRKADMGDGVYATLADDERIHKINFSWFYDSSDDGSKKWEEFEAGFEVTEDMKVYFNVKQIDATITVNGISVPLTLNVPYEKDTRVLDTFKDALFLNENVIADAYELAEQKAFDRVGSNILLDAETRQIKNINKFVTFVDVLSEKRFDKLLHDQLKSFLGSGEIQAIIAEVEEIIANMDIDQFRDYIEAFLADTSISDADRKDLLHNMVINLSDEVLKDLAVNYIENPANVSSINTEFMTLKNDKAFVDFVADQISSNATLQGKVKTHITAKVYNHEYNDVIANAVIEKVDGMSDADIKNQIKSFIDDGYITLPAVTKADVAEIITPAAKFNEILDKLNTLKNADVDAKLAEIMSDVTGAAESDILAKLGGTDIERNDIFTELKNELANTTTEAANAKADAVDYISGYVADHIDDADFADVKEDCIDDYIGTKLSGSERDSFISDAVTDNISAIIDSGEFDDDVEAEIDSLVAKPDEVKKYISTKTDFTDVIEILQGDVTLIEDMLDTEFGEGMIEDFSDKKIDEIVDAGTIEDEFLTPMFNAIKTIDVETVIGDDLEFAEALARAFGHSAADKIAACNKFIDEIEHSKTFEVNVNNVDIIETFEAYLETIDDIHSLIDGRIPDAVLNKLPLDIFDDIYVRTIKAYENELLDAVAAVKGGATSVRVNSGITISVNPVSEILLPLYEYVEKVYDAANAKASAADGKLGEIYRKLYVDNVYASSLFSYTNPEKWFVGTANDHTAEYSGYKLADFDLIYENIKALVVLSDDAFVWYCNNIDFATIEGAVNEQEERILNYANLVAGIVDDYSANGIPESIIEMYNDFFANEMLNEDLEKAPADVKPLLDRFVANAVVSGAYIKVLDKIGIRAESVIDIIADKVKPVYTKADIDASLEKCETFIADGNANITTDYVFDKVVGDDYASIDNSMASIEVERTYFDKN